MQEPPSSREVFLKTAVLPHKRLPDITFTERTSFLPELESIFPFFLCFTFKKNSSIIDNVSRKVRVYSKSYIA